MEQLIKNLDIPSWPKIWWIWPYQFAATTTSIGCWFNATRRRIKERNSALWFTSNPTSRTTKGMHYKDKTSLPLPPSSLCDKASPHRSFPHHPTMEVIFVWGLIQSHLAGMILWREMMAGFDDNFFIKDFVFFYVFNNCFELGFACPFS